MGVQDGIASSGVTFGVAGVAGVAGVRRSSAFPFSGQEAFIRGSDAEEVSPTPVMEVPGVVGRDMGNVKDEGTIEMQGRGSYLAEADEMQGAVHDIIVSACEIPHPIPSLHTHILFNTCALPPNHMMPSRQNQGGISHVDISFSSPALGLENEIQKIFSSVLLDIICFHVLTFTV